MECVLVFIVKQSNNQLFGITHNMKALSLTYLLVSKLKREEEPPPPDCIASSHWIEIIVIFDNKKRTTALGIGIITNATTTHTCVYMYNLPTWQTTRTLTIMMMIMIFAVNPHCRKVQADPLKKIPTELQPTLHIAILE